MMTDSRARGCPGQLYLAAVAVGVSLVIRGLGHERLAVWVCDIQGKTIEQYAVTASGCDANHNGLACLCFKRDEGGPHLIVMAGIFGCSDALDLAIID